MSTIDKEGFLSGEIHKSIAYYREKHKEIFDISHVLNRECVLLINNSKIDWENQSRLVIQALFLKVLEKYQAIIILLERGMTSSAKVLARAIFETTFIIVALTKDPGLLKNYIDQHHDRYKKALKSALQFKSSALKKAMKEIDVEKRYLEKKAELKDKELEILAPKTWAKLAGLDDFYNLYYVKYSNATHSNISALDDHVDKLEETWNLAFGPSDNDLYEMLKGCTYSILNCASCCAEINNLNIDDQLKKLEAKIVEHDKKC